MAEIEMPITQEEADKLHALGWSSGFGWESELDWYHNPSFGEPIFIEDDAGYMARFMDDLASIRREKATELQRKAGPALYEALDKLLTLTKFELAGTGNAERNPWRRNIERCEAALAAAREK